MKKNKMSRLSRIIIAIGSLALLSTCFLPLWFIFLFAPQYPEGLTMNIWLNKLSGQVQIINGLNHYIGMKPIKAEMFPEFGYLIYVVGFFILFGLLVAITGKRKLLFTYLITALAGGIAAMYDFYQWGYDYGHHLNPHAAIQVPGLSYQPPMLGHKKLLNFDAYSYPDVGGWIVISVAAVFFIVWAYEWYKAHKMQTTIAPVLKRSMPVAASVLLFLLNSCSVKPQPFAYGKDNCDDCSMTIMEPNFGGEIITKKGKIFKFDDAHCLVHFLKAGNVKEADISQTVFVDYNKPKNFLDVKSSFFVVSDQLKSPMNGDAASFSSKELAQQKANEKNGIVKSWEQLYQSLQ